MLRMSELNIGNVHEKGLLCAYLSNLAYLDFKSIEKHLIKSGFQNIQLFKIDNLEYFICYLKGNMYIVFRGTDTKILSEQLRDLWVSIQLFPVTGYNSKARKEYKIHNGYRKYGNRIYRNIKPILDQFDGDITFCGHSLGGVLAKYIGIKSDKACDIYTYGSPTLATFDYYSKRNFKRIVKYVNNKDLIPAFPSKLYDDYQDRIYNIVENGSIVFAYQKHNGFIKPLFKLIKNIFTGKGRRQLKDHSIKRYLKHIHTHVLKKNKNLTK